MAIQTVLSLLPFFCSGHICIILHKDFWTHRWFCYKSTEQISKADKWKSRFIKVTVPDHSTRSKEQTGPLYSSKTTRCRTITSSSTAWPQGSPVTWPLHPLPVPSRVMVRHLWETNTMKWNMSLRALECSKDWRRVWPHKAKRNHLSFF